MSQTNDGGPAFPCQWRNTGDLNSTAPDGQLVPPNGIAHLPGMSLRDWFAGQALAGLLAHDCDRPKRLWIEGDTAEQRTAKFAEAAYKLADAMLQAREAKPS